MAIIGASLLKGTPTLSVTGGTAFTLSLDGTLVTKGIHVSDFANTDFRTRLGITVRSVPAPFQNGVYGKDEKTLKFSFPVLLASGLYGFETLTLQRRMYAESAVARGTELNALGSQALFNAGFLSFWQGGATA